MFTGIITDVGTVKVIDKKGDWIVQIESSAILDHLVLGASVACSGICLTVISKTDRSFDVQLSSETLEKTNAQKWGVGTSLNLERALRLGDELGGHMVTGHVDGLARVLSCDQEKESLRFRFEVEGSYASYIATKGSVALDGISLTVNEVEGNVFGVNIIPYTQQHTTMGKIKVGDHMNLEIDLMARYVARRLDVQDDNL
ncbi:MAG TPA: riboflavin synthase [Rhodospirillaceae bacterium]|nr:riboflavin synthase [Rhodospirillaceae bacterium]